MQRFIQTSDRVRGLAQEARIELAIGGDEHHFWSPQLVATVRAEPDGRAHLDARFGPDPYVWVLYLLAYMALSVTTLIALAFGFSQVLLKQPPTALYFAPVAAVLAAIVYGASYVGQGLGSDQMYFLRTTLNLAEAEDEADLVEHPGARRAVGRGLSRRARRSDEVVDGACALADDSACPVERLITVVGTSPPVPPSSTRSSVLK